MNDLDDETEEQTAARIRDWRARASLNNAPAIAEHVRALATRPGVIERGVEIKHMHTPLATEKVDDIDSMYAQILNWVDAWSTDLDVMPPATHPVAWSNRREVQGFRADTTPAGAAALVRMQTIWLLLRMDRIVTHPNGVAFQEDIAEIVGRLRGKYPMAPRAADSVSPRPCPVCQRFAVHADWYSDQDSDVDVRCEACGYIIPVKHLPSGATDEWLPTKHIDEDPLIAAEVRRELISRPYLRPSEVAVLFDKTTRAVQYWITNGMPAVKIDGEQFVQLADVHEWLLTHPTRKAA